MEDKNAKNDLVSQTKMQQVLNPEDADVNMKVVSPVGADSGSSKLLDELIRSKTAVDGVNDILNNNAITPGTIGG